MSKLWALILVSFLCSPLVLTTNAQTATPPQPGTPVEPKARAVALLDEAQAIIPQLKSPYNRIKTQLLAGNLLWETDEKLATKFFSAAMDAFKEYLASLEPNDPYFQSYSMMSQLRYDLVQAIAPRLPDAALDFLHSTQTIERSPDPRDRLTHEMSIELSITAQIARKDPARALKLARRSLKKKYSTELVNTVSELSQQNPEMGAEFANEIVTKLMSEKLLKDAEAAHLAAGLIQLCRTLPIRLQSRNRNGDSLRPTLLPDEQYRGLLQKMLAEVTSSGGQPQASDKSALWNLLNGLQGLGPTLETIMPGGDAAVEKKFAELNGSPNSGSDVQEQFQKAITNGSVDASFAIIEKAPPELREEYYAGLANILINNGELERAKQVITEHVTNPYKRRQGLVNLEQQRVSQATNSGKVEEALTILGGFGDKRDRAQHLVQVVNQIGPGRERATALKLLEQARSLLDPSPRAEDQTEMAALFEIARAFSRYDSKRTYEILDPLIEQFNEISAAARTLEGFGLESFEDGELNLYAGNDLGTVAGNLSGVLGTLALSDFDRAKEGADKIQPLEVRLKAYLDIAEQMIKAGK